MRLLFCLLLLSWQQSPQANTSVKYDHLIKSASLLYLPEWDWRWYRAQLEQESSLNPNAISPVGAKGIAQFMPATWSDMQKQLNFTGSRNDAYKSIRAGAFYNSQLRKSWKWERPECDRRRLTFASYNAGLGNVLKAQQRCKQSTYWPQIKICMPDVTGHHALETVNYVSNIEIRYQRQTAVNFKCDYSVADINQPVASQPTQKGLFGNEPESSRVNPMPGNKQRKQKSDSGTSTGTEPMRGDSRANQNTVRNCNH